MASGIHASSEEIKGLFDRYDANKDGRISVRDVSYLLSYSLLMR